MPTGRLSGQAQSTAARGKDLIMAKRKKRAKVLRRKLATARDKVRKASESARAKTKKRTIATAKPKRAGVQKAAHKKVQRIKQETPAVETVVVDVIDEPVPGVITITEFEETEVRERTRGRDEPEEC
jgi:hypothetical protein